MKQKKIYQKATMKVVNVETETHLLSDSSGSVAASFSRVAFSGSSATWN